MIEQETKTWPQPDELVEIMRLSDSDMALYLRALKEAIEDKE